MKNDLDRSRIDAGGCNYALDRESWSGLAACSGPKLAALAKPNSLSDYDDSHIYAYDHMCGDFLASSFYLLFYRV